MSEISKITLPSGATYDIKDEEARTLTIDSIYTLATLDLELLVTTPASVDEEEF